MFSAPLPRRTPPRPLADPMRELETLARRYLALPVPAFDPQAPALRRAEPPERQALRAQIWRLLVGGWVRFAVNDDGKLTQPERQRGALERLMAEEARRLANEHGQWLQEQFGGGEPLRQAGQQELVRQQMERHLQRQQTALTGMLQDWDPARGSLGAYLRVMARHCLVGMARALNAPTGRARDHLDAGNRFTQSTDAGDAQGSDDDGAADHAPAPLQDAVLWAQADTLQGVGLGAALLPSSVEDEAIVAEIRQAFQQAIATVLPACTAGQLETVWAVMHGQVTLEQAAVELGHSANNAGAQHVKRLKSKVAELLRAKL